MSRPAIPLLQPRHLLYLPLQERGVDGGEAELFGDLVGGEHVAAGPKLAEECARVLIRASCPRFPPPTKSVRAVSLSW